MNATTNLRTANSYSGFTESEIYYPETDGEPMAETDKHRDLLTGIIETLKNFYIEDEDVYVTGNLLFYYVEGVPQECVAPDIMVCFGVPKDDRRTYKLWEENVVPSVIIELASHSTFRKDRTEKRELYESLGVKEYFIYNPEYPKTLPSLIAYRLNGSEYEKLRIEDGRISSVVLNLELVDTGNTLRLYNRQTDSFLLNYAELVTAETRARTAEAEVEKLRAQLAELKNGQ
jgi:Uma2 family endonuclease